ncbi:MAG TPA: endonuclease/exonuclease/phosphatase family protein [Jatrophihabitantaceae bacterium]|jgi:endonuclease/exonuclease/phosphatase family metal-dependent hydrolase
MRLLTYNVRSLRDDGTAVARVIRDARPDVVCIQEAPRFLRGRSKCAALARRSGLVIVGGGRSAAANLLLSTPAVEVESSRDVLFSKDARLHQRGAAISVLRLGEARVAVAGTHLDLVEAPRLRHIAELERALDAHVPAGVPTVIAGDINGRPGSPAWQLLTERRVDAVPVGDGFTYSATHPRRRIDGVFADPALRIVSAEVLDSPEVRIASDHRPVLVELEL